MKKIFILMLISLMPLVSFSRDLGAEQKLADLNELVAIIQAGYGPLEYKKQTQGIDLKKLTQKYTELIKASKNNSEFYYLIVQFVAEFNDSHFGARIPTKHSSSLGFHTDLVQGKVLIEKVNRQVLTTQAFSFERGDEIIAIDGVSAQDILNELVPYMGQGTKLTALRKAASLVSYRHGSIVPVKTGESEVEIKRFGSEVVEKVKLKWNEKGKALDEFIPTKRNTFSQLNQLDYDQLSLGHDPVFERSFRCSGGTRIKIPTDATIIMEKPFVAYYYPTDKGNIGYLRIPHYSPRESDPTVNAAELRFSQYEYAVKKLEENTVGLIIDQDHNCGGSVLYLHQILTLFSPKAFSQVQFELLASKESYLRFNSWSEYISKFTLDYESIKKVTDLVYKTWMETTDFLTSKIGIFGDSEFTPNEYRYTKPVIVLIDELSGSGGDAFPAMMQGLGIAKLLGTRTMGAGGHVISLPPLAHSQITVRMTKSLFYHPNNIAIENNGASPDIPYAPTVSDFKYGYLEYQRFYTQKILEML